MRRTALAVGTLVVALVASPAHAAERGGGWHKPRVAVNANVAWPPDPQLVGACLDLARTYWQRHEPGMALATARVVVAAKDPAEPTGVTAFAWASSVSDTIWLSPERHFFTPAGLATLLAHEYGHLLGFSHSADPEDIMAPSPTAEVPGARRMQRRWLSGWRPASRAAGPATAAR